MGKVTHQSIDSDLRGYSNIKTGLEDVESQLALKATQADTFNGEKVGFIQTDNLFSPSIYPVSGTVLNVVAKTLARQDSSVAPTPDAPKPITGHSTLSHYHAGKNLCESRGAASSTTNGITFTKNADGSVRAQGTATGDAYYSVLLSSNRLFLPKGIYTFKGEVAGSGGSTYQIYYTTYDLNNTIIDGVYPGVSNTTRTYLNDVTVKADILVKSGQTVDVTFYPQIEKGTVSTAYEKYAGLVSSITPASVLYGLTDSEDTWDLNAGIVTHKTKKVTLNGSESWGGLSVYTNTVRVYATVADDSKKVSRNKIICDKFPSKFGSTEDFEHIRNDYNTSWGVIHLYINKSRLATADVAGVKTWLAANPVTVVYELETPTTETFTPVNINSVNGVNSLYSTGNANTNVTYNKKVVRVASEKPYKNKVGILLGDSISARNDDWAWNVYFSQIVEPITINNVAVAGATWCDSSTGIVYDGTPQTGVQNFIGNQVQKILNNSYAVPDYIIIAAGTNDINFTVPTDTDVELAFYSGGNKITDLSTLDRTTWAGAMRWSIEKLRAKYPDTKIILMTPLQRAGNVYAQTLAKNQIIKKMALRLGVEVIDAMNCGIYDMTGSVSVEIGDYTDGLHPSIGGAKKIGKYVAQKFINLFNY